MLKRLPWRRKPSPSLVATQGPRCGDCRFLHMSPAAVEGRKPNGTDFDLPCSAFGQQAEYQACAAFERARKRDPAVSAG